MTLATRIAVMSLGRVAQVGTPGEVYEFPANRYVADFVGDINLIDGLVTACDQKHVTLRCEALNAELRALSTDAWAAGSPLCLAVRPEKITLSRNAPEAADRNVLRGVVWDLGYFGDQSLYRIKLPSGALVQVSAEPAALGEPQRRMGRRDLPVWDLRARVPRRMSDDRTTSVDQRYTGCAGRCCASGGCCCIS
jgi:ABC-type Fe3+/spermidine/putrescine transport system ATPase subunit